MHTYVYTYKYIILVKWTIYIHHIYHTHTYVQYKQYRYGNCTYTINILRTYNTRENGSQPFVKEFHIGTKLLPQEAEKEADDDNNDNKDDEDSDDEDAGVQIEIDKNDGLV